MFSLEQDLQKWQIFILKNRYGIKNTQKPNNFTVILLSSLMVANFLRNQTTSQWYCSIHCWYFSIHCWYFHEVFSRKRTISKYLLVSVHNIKMPKQSALSNKIIHGLHIYDLYFILLEWAWGWWYVAVVLWRKAYILENHGYWVDTNGASDTNPNW